MILKTLPLPSPAAAQMTRTTAKNPTNASNWRKAERLNPPSAMIPIEMEVIKPAPNLSANQPPRGRITLAIAAARAETDVRLIAAVGKDFAASPSVTRCGLSGLPLTRLSIYRVKPTTR
jgi:hypothetical protein